MIESCRDGSEELHESELCGELSLVEWEDRVLLISNEDVQQTFNAMLDNFSTFHANARRTV